jgi:hypothetical protein
LIAIHQATKGAPRVFLSISECRHDGLFDPY